MRLCEFDERHAKLLCHGAAELARADAQSRGQVFQAAAIAESAGFNARDGGPCQGADGIDGGMPRREFRAAA